MQRGFFFNTYNAYVHITTTQKTVGTSAHEHYRLLLHTYSSFWGIWLKVTHVYYKAKAFAITFTLLRFDVTNPQYFHERWDQKRCFITTQRTRVPHTCLSNSRLSYCVPHKKNVNLVINCKDRVNVNETLLFEQSNLHWPLNDPSCNWKTPAIIIILYSKLW